MLIAFSLQTWLNECASMLRLYEYVDCLFGWFIVLLILKGVVVLNNWQVRMMDSVKEMK